MNHLTVLVSLFLLIILANAHVYAETHRHGAVMENNQNQLLIWSTSSNKWKSVENFWLEYAKERGGLTWGKSEDYPEYDKVKEHDTLLIQVNGGVCLMEFFHQRWRRANDVRRWNEALSNYSGCPYVFDTN